MIKLIASDIDGTLIPYGETGLSQKLFPLLHGLREAGILFCPASGRQYHSMRRLFAPVAEEVYFLCENGAILYGPAAREEDAPILARTPMPRGEALDLAQAIVDLPGCELLVSGDNTSYVCRCPREYTDYLRENKGNNVTEVAGVEQLPREILKVSAYCPGGTDGPQEALGPRWSHLGMAAADPDWVDFTLANKGTGIRTLCKALGIAPQEVAAFGDNWNDRAMLQAVGEPWLMSAADPELRAQFPRQCADVLTVLEEILRDRL